MLTTTSFKVALFRMPTIVGSRRGCRLFYLPQYISTRLYLQSSRLLCHSFSTNSINRELVLNRPLISSSTNVSSTTIDDISGGSDSQRHLYGWGHGLYGITRIKSLSELQLSSPHHLTTLETIMRKDAPLMACGWRHSLMALNNDDGVYGFGLNQSGQLGMGKCTSRTEGKVFGLPVGRIKALAAGREHSIVVITPNDKSKSTLLSDKIFAFGSSTYGQLGIGASKWRQNAQIDFRLRRSNERPPLVFTMPQLVELPSSGQPIEIRQVVCGMDHTVFLTESGSIYTCGWGADGQLGLPNSTVDHDTPMLISLLIPNRVMKLAASTDFTLALTDNNELYAWGNGEYGQCMTGKKIDRIMAPTHVTTIPTNKYGRIVDMAAGDQHGHVFSCGYAVLGQASSSASLLSSTKPLLVPNLPPIRQLACSTNYAMVIDEQGQLYTWGLAGRSGALGQGNLNNIAQPTRITFPSINNTSASVPVVSSIVCGGCHVLAVIDEHS
ncbi:regulator of chromosome condensation 1/beta-lactamase-inhibitor protein II [Syncephalis fuscata]|nr:regulator of chromosome condensation 1/beta-lactamase-inhibitor protein II [Syncephalis fuscata]